MAGVHYIWQQMCSIRHIELSTYLQQKRRYVGMNILSWLWKTAITLDSSGTIHVDIAQTGWWALYVARNVEYHPHRIVDIPATATEIRLVEYLSLNQQNYNYTAYNGDQNRHNADQLMCSVFGRKFGLVVGIFAIEAKTHWSECLFLNTQYFIYAALHKVQRGRSAKRLVCSVFACKSGV